MALSSQSRLTSAVNHAAKSRLLLLRFAGTACYQVRLSLGGSGCLAALLPLSYSTLYCLLLGILIKFSTYQGGSTARANDSIGEMNITKSCMHFSVLLGTYMWYLLVDTTASSQCKKASFP